MDWQEAKNGTIRQWIRVRDCVASEDEVLLLTEINAVCDLCEISRAEAPGPEERCDYCHFYQQFGGCQEISWQMTQRVTEHDWDGLRELIDGFIGRLHEMDRPTVGGTSPGA